MRRALLLAIAACAAADTPEIRLPEASAARPPLEGAAAVALTADGLILVEQDGKPESVSVEKLGVWLCARIEAFEKKPKGSVQPAGPGQTGTATKMPALVRADENAPWLHVQRVLEACREAGIARIAFGVKGARGEEGRLGPEEPSPAWDEQGGAKLTVVIAVTREDTAVWGPAQTGIRTPAELTYRMGGIASTRIDAVRRYLRDAGQTAAEGGSVIRPSIEPEAKVPWGAVVSVLNEYHRAGLTDARIRFLEQPATDDERRASRLAYPSSSR
ncbi:MAG TPA: biopolymer transporter ExbD [Planctomycetota bacterium]|nr:biopolymer transporter ExbD [Planctomycetota bacterium]